jgi:hypothetical protein
VVFSARHAPCRVSVNFFSSGSSIARGAQPKWQTGIQAAEPLASSPKHQSNVVAMKKTSKVILFPPPENRIIATDEVSRRVIVGIGRRRIAFDFFTRVTELPPATGDRPAPIVPIKKKLRK